MFDQKICISDVIIVTKCASCKPKWNNNERHVNWSHTPRWGRINQYWRKWVRKCPLQNGCHFVLASQCWAAFQSKVFAFPNNVTVKDACWLIVASWQCARVNHSMWGTSHLVLSSHLCQRDREGVRDFILLSTVFEWCWQTELRVTHGCELLEK